MKFVHAADLHLDSPLRGLARNASVPIERVRTATRRALSNLVELCVDEDARLLVLAGDLYDGDWRDYSTGLFFTHQMARLRDAGVRVVMIRGNHDAASQITKHLRLPDNVRELSHHNAETLCLDDLGIALHGQSFATRAVMQNLAESYPERVPHLLNLGLLHTSINGREGHEPYAPCSIDLLKSKGYDYWALGHVHAREIVCEAPWVVFPGNLQGRHARETGEKGATIVHYDEHGVRSVEARALDVVRYASASIDLDEVTSFDDALDRVRSGLARELERSDGRTIGVRIVLTGATPLHGRLLCDDGFVEHCRALALELGGEEIFVEKSVVRTNAPRLQSELGAGPLAELIAAIEGTRGDEQALSELASELSELRPKLPPELRDGEDGLHLDDPRFIASRLDAIEQLLITRLREQGER